LQELASKIRPGFLIGANIATWAMASSSSYDQLVGGGDFGIVTPENAMKWQFTEPEPGVFDFHEADAIVAWAKKNNLQVHGHNLVFGEALPAWVRDMPTATPEQKAAVEKVLYDHVYTMVKHFKGSVNEWDINEPFAYYDDNGNIPNPLNDNVFYQAMGENYIRVVCQAAVAADPNIKLWVNDYGAENDTDVYWNNVYNLLKKWKVDWKLPIYGFGFESHIYDPTTDIIIGPKNAVNGINVFNAHINQLAAIGLKSRGSENDAPLQDPGYAQVDSSQAAQMAGELGDCLENPNCVAYSMWSVGPTDIFQNNGVLQQGIDSPFGPNSLPVGTTYAAMQKVLQTSQ
jgi:endo-1,4-beta-xylanase